MYLPSRLKSKHILLAFLIIALVILPFRAPLKVILLFFSNKPHFLAKGKYQQINQQLQNENLTLLLQIAELKHLTKENEKLRKVLKLSDSKKIKIQAADIITFSPSNWRRNALLNKGRVDQVKIQDIAIDENGNLLGKIVDVTKKTSQIVFADDPEFRASAFIGEHGFGLLSGNLVGAKILYIEAGEHIKNGDSVWMRVPHSDLTIDIGTISSVQKDENSLFWDIDVSLFTGNHLSKRVFLLQ